LGYSNDQYTGFTSKIVAPSIHILELRACSYGTLPVAANVIPELLKAAQKISIYVEVFGSHDIDTVLSLCTAVKSLDLANAPDLAVRDLLNLVETPTSVWPVWNW
jgi:hypothetical protein